MKRKRGEKNKTPLCLSVSSVVAMAFSQTDLEALAFAWSEFSGRDQFQLAYYVQHQGHKSFELDRAELVSRYQSKSLRSHPDLPEGILDQVRDGILAIPRVNEA